MHSIFSYITWYKSLCRKRTHITREWTWCNGRGMDFNVTSYSASNRWTEMFCLESTTILNTYLHLINHGYLINKNQSFSQFTTGILFRCEMWICDPLSQRQVRSEGRKCGVRCEWWEGDQEAMEQCPQLATFFLPRSGLAPKTSDKSDEYIGNRMFTLRMTSSSYMKCANLKSQVTIPLAIFTLVLPVQRKLGRNSILVILGHRATQ